VAIIDTGIDKAHPDLVVGDAYFNAFGGASGQDNNGHGTHVAGTVAAEKDGYDVVGVAPGATVYAVKVLDASGSGSESGVIAGVNWVAANWNQTIPNIRVVNMSLGRSGSLGDSPAYRSAITTLVSSGITVVVAAGNSCSAEISQMVPACYPEVIAVSSTTAVDGTSAAGYPTILANTASYFTTDGAGVAIAAPGEDKENVLRGGRLSSVGILSTKLGGGTTRMSGTSMASPHVAGVAALVYATHASSTPTSVRNAITGSANPEANVPLDSPTTCYTFDGIREGVVNAVGATQ
jgi:subtilisin family serine protease